MNWQEYHNNPAIKGEGFWTDVLYGPPLLADYFPTKGFVSVDGQNIVAIGHVWFPQGHHYFLFDKSGTIYSEHQTNKISTRYSEEIHPDLSDRLIFLATDFRAAFPGYARSLDNCVRDVLRLTGKRK